MNYDQHEDSKVPLQVTRQIDLICDQFEALLRAGEQPSFNGLLDQVDPIGRHLLLRELVSICLDRSSSFDKIDIPVEILKANPGLADELKPLLENNAATTKGIAIDSPSSGSGLRVQCPHCHYPIGLIPDAELSSISCPSCGNDFSLVGDGLATKYSHSVSTVGGFRLIERIGLGSFGAVWKALDSKLDRTVAVKIPRKGQFDDQQERAFLREAQNAAQLSHPGIVPVFEVGRDGDTLYIVSEFIRGITLADWLSGQQLTSREAAELCVKLADALHHAHERGVIHRDLKPSNIMMDEKGCPHIMDFGLAKREAGEITVTLDGQVLGTPAYMSPEQASGDGHSASRRSDIYSLGVILFQLLTGVLPFRGNARMLIHQVINNDPPSPRSLDSRISRDIDTICLKCLNKEPSRRYSTAEALADDLRRFLDYRPINARRLSGVGRAARWAKRNKAIAALLLLTVGSLLSAVTISTHFAVRSAEDADRADDQASELADTLYDSLVQEIKLTREVRRQGYGSRVNELVGRALSLDAKNIDRDELRRQLALSMGDFVAYSPTVIDPFPANATSTRISDDGRFLLAGLESGQVVYYDLESGDVAELEPLAHAVQSIAITDSGKSTAAADSRGLIHRWRRDQNNWRLDDVRDLKLKTEAYSVTLSPDAELAAVIDGSSLSTWDVNLGRLKLEYSTDPKWTVRNAAFDLHNQLLAAAYMDANTDTVGWAVWNLETGKEVRKKNIPSLGQAYANSIAFGPGVGRLAVGFDQGLLIYSTPELEQISSFRLDSTKAVAFSPGSELARIDIRGRVTLWNAVDARPLAELEHTRRTDSRECLTFSADGSRLAASNAHSARIWDLGKGDEKASLQAHNGAVPCAAFHPSEHILVTGSKDHSIHFYDSKSGELEYTLELPAAVQALEFSPNGRLLAVGTTGQRDLPHLRLVNLANREVILERQLALGEVYSLSWVGEGDQSLLAVSGRFGVALLQVSQNVPAKLDTVKELKGNWCRSTKLAPDGSTMAWSEINVIHALDVKTKTEKQLSAPQMLQGWHGLAYMPNGQSIIYVAADLAGMVWNIDKDCEEFTFGKPGDFHSPHIALSRDGDWLAALTHSDSVSVWQLSAREHVYSFRPEGSAVWALDWSPMANELVVGRTDGGVQVWHLDRVERKLAEFGLDWRRGA